LFGIISALAAVLPFYAVMIISEKFIEVIILFVFQSKPAIDEIAITVSPGN